MSYSYVSQKMRDFDFFLRNTRTLPLMAIGDNELLGLLKMIESEYRGGKISRQKAAMYAMYVKQAFNIDSVIISDRHIVFLPRNNTVIERTMFSYPQLIALYGNRNSGKTITSWTLGMRFLERFKSGVLHVYGDVDGLGKSLIFERPEFEDRIVVHNEYSLPDPSSRPKMAIYNELSEELISKRAQSGDNLRLNFQALRNRHRKVWVVYNVIRYSSFESVLRDTIDISFYKWMNPTLLNNLLSNVPKAYSEILKHTVRMGKNEALVVAPIPGKGNYIGIYETNPLEYLLHAHNHAHKNARLMMTKDEKDLHTYERIAELKEKGLSGEEISIILKKEGVSLSARAINIRYNKWKRMQEMEATA